MFGRKRTASPAPGWKGWRAEEFGWRARKALLAGATVQDLNLGEVGCADHSGCTSPAVTVVGMWSVDGGMELPQPVCAEHIEGHGPLRSHARIVNLTPHPFTVVTGGQAVLTVPPESTSARLAETQPQVTTLVVDGVDIPVYTTEYGEVSGLPDPQDGVVYLVSQMVVAALPGRRDLYFPAKVVRDDSGRIIGAEGITR